MLPTRDGWLDRRAQDRPASIQSGDRQFHAAARRRAARAQQPAQRRIRRFRGLPLVRLHGRQRGRAERRAVPARRRRAACAAIPATWSPMARRRAPTAACCITRIRWPASSTHSIARVPARCPTNACSCACRRRAAIRTAPSSTRKAACGPGCSAAGACSDTRPQGDCSTTLRLPCSAVTKAAFGGDDLRTLYITTAHVALSAEERTQQPLAGGLFRARVDVPGLPQRVVSHGI